MKSFRSVLVALALVVGMAIGPVWVYAQSNYIVSTAAGTITTSQPLIGAQTWNAGGVSFNGLQLNFTETASAAGSHYLDINGGAGGVTSEFFVAKGGAFTAAGAATFVGYTITGTGTIGNGATITTPAISGYTMTGTGTIANGLTVTTPALAGAGAGVATLQYGNSASSRTYTFPDAGAAGNIGIFSTTPAAIQTTPQTVYANAGYTNATTTFSNIPGLSFAVAANTSYHAVCYLTWNPGGATTVGPKYIWTGPASPTAVTAGGILSKTVTTNSNLSVAGASFATTLDDAVAVTASITQTDTLTLGVVNGVNAGTVQLQAALHSASGTYTLSQGSYCNVQ